MRKIITILALVLTVALCASFAVSAVDPVTISGLSNTTTDASVTVTSKTDDTATKIYSVDVIWNDVAFTYSAGTNQWNPSTHAYDAAGAGGSWTDDNVGQVTVTNHSNAAVEATVSFEKSGTVDITVSDNGLIELATAENTSYANAPTGSVTLTASGTPTQTGNIGKVKVTIAAAN